MNRIKESRTKAGLSQKYVAMTLGVAGPSVSNWESGKTQPTPENLKALASLFGVSVDYLLGSDEQNIRGVSEQPAGGQQDARIAGVLRVSTDYLLGNDSPPASMMGNSSESKRSSVPTGEEAKQGMIAALEKEMSKYFAKRAEAMEILQGMDDDTYEMALNVLKAMKK